ncbi:MAG: CPBP family intramembrane metalloprotease [Bacteroidales bacterium]|nr:CPBP family intramembrane metalloprotease [Bacteroidales bacterium]
MVRLLMTLWESLFGETVRRVEAESAMFQQSAAGQQPDTKTITVLITVAVCLTLQNYTQSPERIIPLMECLAGRVGGAEAWVPKLEQWANDPLTRLTWWAIVVSCTYTILPFLVIRYVFRESLRDYGWKLRGLFSGWQVYLLFVAVMVPLVALCSAERGFQQTYPFLPIHSAEKLYPHLLRWELLYAMQFVALEFFFRGFLVHGTKHRFGIDSIFVMTVPYCMIHFQKPFPECVASIIAGVALGLMSLKTRSIWLGAALHISVAWGMDCACLIRRGFMI